MYNNQLILVLKIPNMSWQFFIVSHIWIFKITAVFIKSIFELPYCQSYIGFEGGTSCRQMDMQTGGLFWPQWAELNSRDEIKGRSRINFVGHWNQNLTLSVFVFWSCNWILLYYVGLTLTCYFHYYFVNIFCSLMYCHHLMCNCARRRLSINRNIAKCLNSLGKGKNWGLLFFSV